MAPAAKVLCGIAALCELDGPAAACAPPAGPEVVAAALGTVPLGLEPEEAVPEEAVPAEAVPLEDPGGAACLLEAQRLAPAVPTSVVWRLVVPTKERSEERERYGGG